MGISAIYCQLCAMPVQHDHYVPSLLRPGMLRIVRAGDTETEPGIDVFPFGPEHAWLLDAVGLPYEETGRVYRGRVDDHDVVDANTGDRTLVEDGGGAWHAYCWNLAGAPARRSEALSNCWNHFYALHGAWQRQLFDFAGAVRDGKGWMLVDPSGDSADAARNRERLARAVGEAKVRRSDRAWNTVVHEDDAHVEHLRHRTDLRRREQPAGLPQMVCIVQEYEPAWKHQPSAAVRDVLERAEVDVKAAVESAGAVFVASKLGGVQPQLELYVYTGDVDAVKARVATVGTFEIQVEHDPTWNVFFGELVEA